MIPWTKARAQLLRRTLRILDESDKEQRNEWYFFLFGYTHGQTADCMSDDDARRLGVANNLRTHSVNKE